MPSAFGTNQSVIPQLPAGSMIDFAGTSAPAGWLMCDGKSLPTATYPALFSSIGYSFGGSGANFNVPDFRGRFARYNDNMGTDQGAAGRDTGRVHGSQQTQATAKNGLANSSSSVSGSCAILTRTEAGWQHTGGFGAPYATGTTNYTQTGTISGTAVAQTITGDAETRPINLSCNRIIKY